MSHDGGSEPRPYPEDQLDSQRISRMWARKWLIVTLVLAAGGLTFGVSSQLPKSFAASSDLIVQAGAVGTLDSVTAVNGLAAQLAQQAQTRAVADNAARLADLEPSVISGKVTAITLANANIVRVTVTGADPELARAGASAVTQALADDLASRSATSSAAADESLGEITEELALAHSAVEEARLNVSRVDSDGAALEVALADLANARSRENGLELKRFDLMRSASVDPASRQVTAIGSDATEAVVVAPMPIAYAATAALVVMVGSAWAASLVPLTRPDERRRRSAAR